MFSRLLLAMLDFAPPPPAQKTGEVSGQRTGYFSQLNPSIIVILLILTVVFFVSASIHLLIRFLERWRTGRTADVSAVEAQLHHLFHNHSATHSSPRHQQSLIDSLPVFSFNSVTGIRHKATDCAVCLSRFQPHDQLRLLPQCSHAFHANCVDSWLVTNSTCPLCRDEIALEPGEASVKSTSSNGASFRLELGSLSRRRDGTGNEISTITATTTTPSNNNNNNNSRGRSYSLGSFDYVVDLSDGEVFVKAEPQHRYACSEIAVAAATTTEKEETPPGVAEEEGSGGVRGWRGNWLTDYVDKLASSASSSFSSRAVSFRLSGAESEQNGYFFLWRSGPGV